MAPLSRSALVILIFCCFLISTNAEQRKNDLDEILNSFPGYHLPTLKELDSDAKAFFLQHFPKANPSVVHADFDGDGRADYALLLRNDKPPVTKLVVLLCSEGGHCRNVYELDVSAYTGSVYLRPVTRASRVSQTGDVDTNHPTSVNLKSGGIRVTYFEKGEVVLYWNKKLKKIDGIATAD